MADVFVSYARDDRTRVAPLVAAIEAMGWSVWWDPEIEPGQEYDGRIAAEIDAAKAVVVVWTPVSVASRWVRGEAREAADRGILVPVRFEQARLPIDVRAIHTTDLDGWGEDPGCPQVQECLRALGGLIAGAQAVHGDEPANVPLPAPVHRDAAPFTICVLPFTNMSGDPEQEYFSDGITEDIITDLSKIAALAIVSRNSAFMYKDKRIDIPKVVRELHVSHVLEGSVRKAAGRVRINAQLIDGASNSHVWAERYDRDSSDIFALQDEISEAIVKALKLRLLPDEKQAIERRGTDNAEAHDLYLMARQTYVSGQEIDARSARAVIRLCVRATEIDPRYAQAWVLMAIGHWRLRVLGADSGDGMAALDRALALAPELAEAHAVKAQLLLLDGDAAAAAAEVAHALALDPESYEVNRSAGRLSYQLRRHADAVRYYEKASGLMEADVNSAMMLISCYTALGDAEGVRHAAQRALARTEAALAHDQNNVELTSYSAYALAALGEGERAKARMARSLLIDPDNFNMRYNFVCALSVHLRDKEAALEMLGPLFETISGNFMSYACADPDFAFLRDDPRFAAMLAGAEARLAAAAKPVRVP